MNGENEQLTFTRQDAERLIRIETKLDGVLKIKEQTTKNTTAIKYIRWVIGSLTAVVIGLLTL